MIQALRTFGLVAVLAACAGPGQSASVSIQIVNPAVSQPLRVWLDQKIIYDATPAKASVGRHGTASEVLGSFELKPSGRHLLTAEVPDSPVRARLEFSATEAGANWIVLHYYPGRQAPMAEPAFFTFSLQRDRFLLK